MELTSKETITFENLRVKWSYGEIKLLDCQIVKKLNNHVRVKIKGIVTKEDAERIVEQSNGTDNLEVVVKDDQGEQTLFMGRLYAVTVKLDHDVYHVEVEGISHTYALDTEKKSQSFQQDDMQYEDLIDKIIEPYNGLMIDIDFQGKEIGKCIIQYEETIWEFCIRLASHIGSVIVPDFQAHKPRFWVGIHDQRPVHQIEMKNLKKQRNLSYYRQINDNYPELSWHELDVTGYSFETYETLELGDLVETGDGEMVIIESKSQIKNGILISQCVCLPKDGIWCPRIPNKNIIGAAIEGKIIDLREDQDQVKLHLNMDETQSKSKASWFPYSIGNKVISALPPKGTPIKLYFPSANEDEALVINSVKSK